MSAVPLEMLNINMKSVVVPVYQELDHDRHLRY